ncbi:transcriptional regulator [Candidatus Dependentiae bacterium]|nr:transcriptional regulator [Candidatus Dependentiae bacterium]
MKKHRHINIQEDNTQQDIQALVATIAKLKDALLVYDFLKDLCTPQELKAMADRWKVCKLLNKEELSYREISEQTNVSLATIVRVARFLHNEPNRGYQAALKKVKNSKKIIK